MIHLIFDTETTGLVLHPSAKDEMQPHIIEWGGLLVDGHGNELGELNVLINPGIPLPERITKITGIKDEDLIGQPLFAEVMGQIREMFSRAEVLIAHNLPFDSNMMKLELARVGLLADWPWPRTNVCTVQEHAEEWGRRPKLTELYEMYMGKKFEQSHRAIDDVRALKEICVAAGVLR
jgi:DNA polymerase III epsilon subunit-like protein